MCPQLWNYLAEPMLVLSFEINAGWWQYHWQFMNSSNSSNFDRRTVIKSIACNCCTLTCFVSSLMSFLTTQISCVCTTFPYSKKTYIVASNLSFCKSTIISRYLYYFLLHVFFSCTIYYERAYACHT